jgi:hypothetical protein
MENLPDPSELESQFVEPRRLHQNDKARKGGALPPDRLLFGRIPAVLEQMVMNIDFDRAGLGAGSTERTGGGEMFPILQPAKVGCDD